MKSACSCLVIGAALMLALFSGCGGDSEGDVSNGGTAGAGGGSAGSTTQGGSSDAKGGDASAGQSSVGGGGQGNAAGDGNAGQGNAAGAVSDGGAASDACGGCDASALQICVYQIGGPGPSHFTCATRNPCGAAAACSCIVGQGTCQPNLMGDPPGYCSCNNGLK